MRTATRDAPHDPLARIPQPALTDQGRLIIMSNRAPIRIVHEGGREHTEPTVGGVGSTFLRLLERHGGVWIAWSGSKNWPGRVPMPPKDPGFSIVFAPLSERDISHYYHGMCNRGLWPLMHYMSLNCFFDSGNWTSYQRVNQTFAGVAAAEARSGDTLWIQDFHLALTPRLIRSRCPDLPIGLFLHVPFPPEQIFRIFPWRRELLEGMMGADLIGFHTPSFAAHFVDCCEGILGLAADRRRAVMMVDGRPVRIGAFPIGIPVDYFAELAASPRVQERTRRIRRAVGTEIMVLGVDRLDYTKGLLQRLLGFERFLELNPEYRRRVTLVQIAVPSRTKVTDYVRLKRDMDELVGHIVGRFSSEGWVPIRYLYNQFGAHELVAYYQAADVALITPLRDGMNLVAKEYVASRLGDDGVLILSEFAGAAEELSEALIVNPYDIDLIAARLKDALQMSGAEKAERMGALRRRVRQNNLERWSGSFLEALAATRAGGDLRGVRSASG